MGSVSTAGFCKAPTCPSAETILRYEDGRLTRGRRRRVAAHLAACDFCGAEAWLLARHPPAGWRARVAEAAPIPAALRRLAEDLISLPAPGFKLFVEAGLDGERLTLTDA